jgi:hypothetical protein
LTIKQYLDRVAQFAGHDYGKMFRGQFGDNDGSSELAMLVSPSRAELGELQRAVAIMTDQEKANAVDLTDDQVQRIAVDAQVDAGNLAIFINGYALYCKRVS